jgi:GNAT superfamily N-acetyltransferase
MSRFITTLEDVEITRAKDVKKHGDHDQSTHGAWATGQSGDTQVSTKTMKTIIERLSETKTPGVTIDLRTGKEPKTGFICSKQGFEKPVKLKDFDADKKKAIEDYIDKNIEELNKEGAHFGGWVVKSEDTVYLDVSRKFDTRQDAVRAMYDNKQEAIYDVKNDSYIYRKDEKDDRTNKAIYGGSSNTYKGYDQRREKRIYRKNLEGDRREPLNENSEHICLGRFSNVKKHREGDHDQATHGSWAAGRFPENSVSKARNGAKDYAYQKGIKQDDTIDYTKVVANRERASKIADVYESLPKMDRDAIDEYESLSTEVEEQFDFMTKELGIKVEFVKDDPYKTSKEMFDDASNGTLKVLSTASTGAHPLFSDNQNDKFRAVHDYFGHAATGRGFGQDGEEAAWVHHSQMFTDKARGALTTETRGQNSFYNNRGKQFADQKVALLPEEFWKVPVSFAKRYTTIYFDYGLKPVLKHGEHDQSEHGNWATGRSEEDVKRISEFKNRGPSITLLDKSLEDTEPTLDRDKAKMMIDNDSKLEDEVVARIDALVATIEEQNGEPMSEEERLANYDDYRNQVIEEYMDEEPNSLENFSQREYGDSIFEPKPIAELKESLNEVYGLERTATFREGDRQGESVTLTSSVDEVTVQGNTIKVVSNVRDDMGNQVNDDEIIRTFQKNEETGTWSVEHEFLRLNQEYRGLGFGSRFLQQSEDYYVAKGLTHITLNAGLEDGARHWANSGFDWNRDKLDFAVEQMDRFINETERRAKLDYFTDNNDNDITLSGEAKQNLLADLGTARALLGNMGTPDGPIKDMKNDNFPKPRDFASLGAGRPITLDDGTKTYSGKILLAGKYLPYMKILTAEGQNLLSGPIDMDGDGMVYDGTPREKPVSSVGKD